jgi:(p)ppGpp synthase/HD superfamily hydrolase
MPNRTQDFIDALQWSNEIHREHTNVPHRSHLMAVASLVMDARGQEDEVIAALLHDVIEDGNDVKHSDVAVRFGGRVADIVEALSDASAQVGEEKKDWVTCKKEHLTYLGNCEDGSILLVSIADKLHNARSILFDLKEDLVANPAWDGFAATKAETIWYYKSLADLFSKRSPSRRLATELSEVVAEIARYG